MLPPGFSAVECDVNGEYPVDCRREGSEVYVPFSFLSKYFEVRHGRRPVSGSQQTRIRLIADS